MDKYNDVVIMGLDRKVKSLEAQNNELVEALKGLLPENEGLVRESKAWAIKKAREVLAKAEGENV